MDDGDFVDGAVHLPITVRPVIHVRSVSSPSVPRWFPDSDPLSFSMRRGQSLATCAHSSPPVPPSTVPDRPAQVAFDGEMDRGSPPVPHCGQTLARDWKKFPFGSPKVPRFGRFWGPNPLPFDALRRNTLKRYVNRREELWATSGGGWGTSDVRSCARGREIANVISFGSVDIYVQFKGLFMTTFAPSAPVQESSPVVPQRPARGELLVPRRVVVQNAIQRQGRGSRNHTRHN